MHLIFVVVLLCLTRAAAAEGPVPTVLGPALDLTHPFDADTIYWPTEEGFVLERGPEGLFAAEIPAFENLAALDRLPPTGATLIALPMKIAGGSGGPLRAVAILPGAK